MTPEDSLLFIERLVARCRQKGETNNQVVVRLILTLFNDSETWFNAHCDNKKITDDVFFDRHEYLMYAINTTQGEMEK